jgi:amino acid adenylation domain-containing protein
LQPFSSEVSGDLQKERAMENIRDIVKRFIVAHIVALDAGAEIGDDTPLNDAGMLDSLSTIKLLSFLAEEFHIEVQEDDLEAGRLASLASIERLVKDRLRVWNTCLPGRSLHSIFESHARSQPDRVAVICGDCRITYAELDARANLVATHLCEAGVASDSVVPIYADRSIEMITGLLGILKAGGAYLPIDPTLPATRVQWLIEDCQPHCVVTTSNMRERLPPSAARIVLLDALREYGRSDPPPSRDSNPEGNLAYVIYTSGSTGNPKGVLVEHGSVISLFTWAASEFRFDEHDVWTVFHSLAFDFSVWEIWGALLFGGCLVVPSFDATRSPPEFARLLRERKVTVLCQTPSAFRQLAPALLCASPGELNSLRTLCFGGERLDLTMLSPWIERYGDSHPKLVNMYGLTETTVISSIRSIRAAHLLSPSVSSIGAPLPGHEFFLLDEKGGPEPDGCPGELYIGGTGVARGYLNRPDLTANRFILRTDLSPGRLYRTGDSVVRQSDGDYVYLGRLDDQIKVRGFRIEPHEIEACICSHPAIGGCVARAHDYGEGDVRLIAYVVPKPVLPFNAEWSERIQADLPSHCRDSLPAHMQPSVFISLPALPITRSGKLDKAALPPPEIHRRPLVPSAVTLTQAKVAAICCEILGRPAVGLKEDFFDLGGTSLSLVRMLYRVNATLGTDLAPENLSSREQITVADISTKVDEMLAANEHKVVSHA